MTKIRVVSSLLLIVFLLALFCSCNTNEYTLATESVSSPYELVSITYSNGSQLTQKVIYNTETQYTYIYDYLWDNSDGVWRIVSSKLTIIDPSGNVVE